ncbi:hypothetical protein HMPREF9134_00566 [Porphyromonas catoniae F0037]|uniref:Uncharacterized protein n=1 Tax=Porphyromonas catoniae F0037 TaxID=1127696 RepID=L1NG36_9PORP|nr:hypothetical protein HMPREF9134_00566 [Porphyromonas catoniae F0037]
MTPSSQTLYLRGFLEEGIDTSLQLFFTYYTAFASLVRRWESKLVEYTTSPYSQMSVQ